MIGKIMIGKSFRGCLLYCLHDKQQNEGHPVVKDRAEVLLYNKCYGSSKELIQQFHDVRLLNQKVAKPVLHITLSLAPGEQLSKDKLMETTEACAKDMGFYNNQYVAIAHKDTGHQHLHIVANRINFDGRTVSDSNSYKKIAAFCRKMELKYELKHVLSPKRYLSREQRQLPRLDQRKERLREHIRTNLSASKSYGQFEGKIKELGYQVLKGRGIAFLDGKGVKVKGSDIGYSLMHIERVLEHKAAIQYRNEFLQKEGLSNAGKVDDGMQNGRNQHSLKPEIAQGKQPENNLSQGLDLLLTPEKQLEAINLELLKKKRKKQNRSLRL